MAFAISSGFGFNKRTDNDDDWKARRIEQDRNTIASLVQKQQQRRIQEGLALWEELCKKAGDDRNSLT